LKLPAKKERARFVIIGDIEISTSSNMPELPPRRTNIRSFISRSQAPHQLINVADKKMVFENTFSGETGVKPAGEFLAENRQTGA